MFTKKVIKNRCSKQSMQNPTPAMSVISCKPWSLLIVLRGWTLDSSTVSDVYPNSLTYEWFIYVKSIRLKHAMLKLVSLDSGSFLNLYAGRLLGPSDFYVSITVVAPLFVSETPPRFALASDIKRLLDVLRILNLQTAIRRNSELEIFRIHH